MGCVRLRSVTGFPDFVLEIGGNLSVESLQPVVRSVEDVIVKKDLGLRDEIHWVSGASAEGKYFFGKQNEIAAMYEILSKYHSVGIEGGQGTGKSSIISETIRRLEAGGIIKSTVNVEPSLDSIDQVKKMVKKAKTEANGDRVAIIIDGENWQNENLPEILEYLIAERDLGCYVLMGVYGDYRHHPGISEEIRGQCDRLLAGGVVINKLLSDEQIRLMLRMDGEQIFSLTVEDYLVDQAGGHPLLASILANETSGMARAIKMKWNDVKWENFWEEVLTETKDKIGGETQDIGRSVRYVKEAGFDPKTWTFQGDPLINQEVYKNMLPRSSSTVFQEWLESIDALQG